METLTRRDVLVSAGRAGAGLAVASSAASATGQVPGHGGTVYYATLRPDATADDSAWYCHLPAALPDRNTTA